MPKVKESREGAKARRPEEHRARRVPDIGGLEVGLQLVEQLQHLDHAVQGRDEHRRRAVVVRRVHVRLELGQHPHRRLVVVLRRDEHGGSAYVATGICGDGNVMLALPPVGSMACLRRRQSEQSVG